MLALDDPLWSDLQHAYGGAADVPPLLRQLASSPGQASSYKDEPWYSLWSSLCHQGDVYTASYAAVPHIVEIACEAAAPIDFSFFQLPVAIEIARQCGRGPEIPNELEAEYQQAIVRLAQAVKLHADQSWSKEMLFSTITALALAKGHHEIASALFNLNDDWIAAIAAEQDS